MIITEIKTMKKINLFLLPILSLLILTTNSCTKNEDGTSGGINLFSLQNDKDLGLQVKGQIEAEPANYPILSEAQYPVAYQNIKRITQTILNSGKVKYKDDFVWEVKIIRDDTTLNAFCTPGGYIYVYTGLIKYLDTEDQLAGVMGHEIAHADKRHSTDALTRQYGISFLLQLILGSDPSVLSQVANTLLTLQYSRANETEADESSVTYLCPTLYKANGAAGFFEKLNAAGGGTRPPVFLSTHPNPDNRIENINTKNTELGCTGTSTNTNEYAAFKASLP